MEYIPFRNTYWNYYTQIERDFFSYAPYCEIDEQNTNAFSTRYLQLLLSICGEIDSIFKTFCKALKPDLDTNTCGMTEYIDIITDKYPTFALETVAVVGYQYKEICPWRSIHHNKHIPNWWSKYNKVKHHRDEIENGKENYKNATQGNVIEALSALYVLIEYWAAFNLVIDDNEEKNTSMPCLKSEQFRLTKWNFYWSFFGGGEWLDTKSFFEYIKPSTRPNDSNKNNSKEEGSI